MISIANISPEFDEEGLQLYDVRVNDRSVATFYHLRSKGLAECLRLAAAAIDLASVSATVTVTNSANA